MSNAKAVISLDEARKMGESFIDEISFSVSRVVVAGSVRRGKEYVHDIEIVAIPRIEKAGIKPTQSQLLSDGTAQKPPQLLHSLYATPHVDHLKLRMDALLDQGRITRDRPRKDNKSNPFGPRYYRISYIYDGVDYPIDLFAVKPPAQWGVVFLIRTGSADYSHWIVQQGYRYGIKVVDGHLERLGVTIDTPQEIDVFNAIHVPFVEPRMREYSWGNRLPFNGPGSEEVLM